MWKEGFETRRSESSRNQGQQDPNIDRLLTVALAVAVVAFFASTLPLPLFAPVMRDVLFMYAFGAAFVAVARRDRLFADRITAWDQAAIFMLLGLLSGFFVDPEAVSQVLSQLAG